MKNNKHEKSLSPRSVFNLCLRHFTLAILTTILLSGCGNGGGGGGGSSASPVQQTATATLQTGTIAVGSTEVGTAVTVTNDSSGQRVLIVENAGSKLTNAQIGQIMVFEASNAMPLGFAGKLQSLSTTDSAGTLTTTASFTPVSITDVFQYLNMNLSNVATNPQLVAGVAMQNGVRAYTKTTPQTGDGILGEIQNALIVLDLVAKNTDTVIGVDFSGGVKATFWKVKDQNDQWVWTGEDPGTPAPRVDIVFTGQVELENPNFSQANIVIENGKLVTHNLQLQGTLKRNIKASITGNFQVSAADLGELFSKQPTGRFYTKNSTYNEINFDYKGASVKVYGVEKDPSKIILGAAIISAVGVVPTYGNSQTGNVLKTVPVGMVVTFFMTADMQVEASLSLGYQWRDMDINSGMGFSYDDSLGLPVSLLTGQYKMPVPFWDATTHLNQTEGASYNVSGSANATLTAGVGGGIVLVGLEIAQATVEGGIRGKLAGQLSKPVSGTVTGCYSNASVTAGVRALLDVAAGIELKTDFKSKWLKWLDTSVVTGYVYEFPMYPAEGVDYLAETTIWSAGDDTCHNPQFSATAGIAPYSYNFDASATTYQPLASSYAWDFGDDSTASGVTATHTYSNPGSYTTILTVLFSDGVQKTISKTIVVEALPALNPSFTVSLSGLQASFDASASTPSAAITGYSWSFGDGSTATGITATHTYALYSNSSWPVTLTVTDSYGRTASTSQNVSITAPSISKAWGTAQLIENIGGNASAPHVAVDSNGNAIAVWWQDLPGSTEQGIWANRYTAGLGWGTAQIISSLGANPSTASYPDPRVAVDGEGNAIAAWLQQCVGGGKCIYASHYTPAQGWGSPMLLNQQTFSSVNTESKPRIAVSTSGVALVVWEQSIAGNQVVVFAVRYVPGVGWSSPQGIHNLAAHSYAPDVAIDGIGNGLIVWRQSAVSVLDGIYASRCESGMICSTPQRIGGIDDVNSGNGEAHVAMSSNGEAVAIWEQMSAGSLRLDAVWANRFTSAAGWGGPTLVGQTYYVGDTSKVAIDPNGNATAAWVHDDGTVAHIYANRYLQGAGWGSAQAIDGTIGGYRPYESSLEIAMDASGGASVVWDWNDGTEENIFANRFVPGYGWGTPESIARRTDDVFTSSPTIAMQSNGDAMSVWVQRDLMTGSYYDISVWANRLQALTQCSDGTDNDGDGLVDLADPGCSSAQDNSEFNISFGEF